ncbi:MAG TPA: hypothetical protein ACFYEM_00745 [Candidatus Hypogeohydataceae bacterium YC40]
MTCCVSDKNREFIVSEARVPKISAALEFVESTGKEVLITSPEVLASALEGKTGTRITKNV